MDNLLRRHSLPNKLRYESRSKSTNVVSEAVVNQTGSCQLAYSPAVSSQLHETLIRSTDWIFPRDDEHIGRTVHDASAVSTFAEHLDSTSTWAKDAARDQLVSGEMGESHFLMAYLILPLNNLLRLIFRVPGGSSIGDLWGSDPGENPTSSSSALDQMGRV